PSHIITQTQCDVCDVSPEEVEEAARQMLDSRPQVISLRPKCLSDIYADMNRIGSALGVEAESKALVGRIKSEAEEIRHKCSAVEKQPSTAFIEWIDPLMPGANWMPELIRLAGGKNLFGQ